MTPHELTSLWEKEHLAFLVRRFCMFVKGRVRGLGVFSWGLVWDRGFMVYD